MQFFSFSCRIQNRQSWIFQSEEREHQAEQEAEKALWNNRLDKEAPATEERTAPHTAIEIQEEDPSDCSSAAGTLAA
jgi:hypothetical protein